MAGKKGPTVKVRIITAFSLGGGVDVFPGDVVEFGEVEAKQKVERGWAAYVRDEDADAGVVTQRDPAVINRVPVMRAAEVAKQKKEKEAKRHPDVPPGTVNPGAPSTPNP